MSAANIRLLNLILPILPILLLCGCMGKNYRPVIDPKGVNMSQYELDLLDCQAIAGEQSIIAESAQTALVGATAGAVVGTVVGAIFGDPAAGAASGAGYGGAGGAVDGAVSGLRGQSQIVANCMSGRGYRVLR